MTILELYHDICQRLKDVDIPDCDSEAVILIDHFLHLNQSQIFLDGQRPVDTAVYSLIKNALATRIGSRCPLAYIIGEQDFWSRTFRVSAAVLIPRQETEILVEKVLRTVKPSADREFAFMDLGTGSGVLAVTLTLEIENSRGVAIDRSMSALRVARDNANRYAVGERLYFLQADWYSAVRPGQKFDLVVANPPYVAGDILKDLQPELDHEPSLALDGGRSGMKEIQRIAGKVHEVLRPGGWFFMEIGFDQGGLVLDLFNSFDLYQQVMIHNDYAGLPRILQARLT
ncbi:MAG: peptide chain release factor N(5)-glutamine methyltransferase [Deltaproteobacteria bacterium]|nr:peptide chain release factor N(5)-glutamine methyltransferase [Deltaproteobacteria bacterium]